MHKTSITCGCKMHKHPHYIPYNLEKTREMITLPGKQVYAIPSPIITFSQRAGSENSEDPLHYNRVSWDQKAERNILDPQSFAENNWLFFHFAEIPQWRCMTNSATRKKMAMSQNPHGWYPSPAEPILGSNRAKGATGSRHQKHFLRTWQLSHVIWDWCSFIRGIWQHVYLR